MTIFFRRLAHYAVYLVGGVVILLSAAALTLRLVVMPNINQYKGQLEAEASRAVGMPIKIADIEADWWRIDPRFSLRDVTLSAPNRTTPLQLGRVDATVSWLSLFLMEPYLSNLDIYQPSLDIRRDKNGTIFVAGIPVNKSGTASPFPDWLIRQRNVTVTGGSVTWTDETLNAPPLALKHVNLVLRNGFNRHRFGLTATPPAEAAKSLDIRGDLSGASVHDLPAWYGRIYVRSDGASSAALNTWSPWAQSAVRRSVGNIRFWADLQGGQVTGLVGDVSLADVAVSLDKDLPDMVFDHISGRLGWQKRGEEQTYYVKQLKFVTPEGQTAEPSDVQISFTPTPAGKIESARVQADRLRLEALTAISGAVPLPRQVHDWITTFNPHGFIEHIDFNWLGREHFRLQTRFRDAGMSPTRNLPGFTGLNGEVQADENRGSAKLNSNALHLSYDKVFRQALNFRSLAADLSWSGQAANGYRFNLDRCTLSNPDLDGTVQGSLSWHPGSAPAVDIQAHLTRGNGDAVWRYLPHQTAEDAYEWVKNSIIGGISTDTRLTLRGSLDKFPFDKGGGEFQVKTKIEDGTLDYAPGWPRITGINGWLTFQGTGMTITADSGNILGVRLSGVQGTIPDLMFTHDQQLNLTGHANGPTAAFLDFIRQSPINAHMGGFTENMKADGSAALNLQLDMPLSHVVDTRIAGRLALKDNNVQLNDRLPPLTRINGVLKFTDTQVKGDGLTAALFDQPIVLSLNSETGGRVHANASGTLSAAVLARWLPSTLSHRLSGSTSVQADISMHSHVSTLKLTSPLTGLAIDLPDPLGKTADQKTPLTVTLQDTGDDHPPVTFQYGTTLAGYLIPDDLEHLRLALMLGGAPATEPKNEGITVQGTLHRLDYDVWRKLDLGGATGNGPTVRSVNLTFNELKAYDRLFHDINVQARPDRRAWRFSLNGREVQGDIVYGPQAGTPGDTLTGQFKKLDLPKSLGTATDEQDEVSPDDLPKEIDLSVQSLAYDKHSLGALVLKLTSVHDGLSINKFTLDAPEGHLESSGWLSASPLRTTQLDLKMHSANLGQLMGRLGFQEAVKGGDLSVQGTLNWQGRPEDFAKDRIGGKLHVNLKNGRFTQLDPGAAKLLGILSLQALPRRITLDFRDIFSEGFAFDNIQGDVLLDRGIGYLPDLFIQGPAAQIHMKGQIDLVKESQALRLHIQPRLDEGVAVAGALLGGPVVGVGALVATKLLKDPIAKAASFEYLVTGTWDDPVVSKLSKPVAEKAESQR